MAGQGRGAGRHPVEERGEQVIARHRDGQPVQHRVGQPDRGAGGGGQGQAQAEVRGDLPGSGRPASPIRATVTSGLSSAAPASVTSMSTPVTRARAAPSSRVVSSCGTPSVMT